MVNHLSGYKGGEKKTHEMRWVGGGGGLFFPRQRGAGHGFAGAVTTRKMKNAGEEFGRRMRLAGK